MQAITHFTVGILLQILLINILYPLGLVLTIIACFFSHFLVDTIALITYHPSEPKPKDKFWVIYHIILGVAAGIVLVWFWVPFWIGMGFATLVDIWDWGIIRGVRYVKKDPNWMEKYQIHPTIDKIRDKGFYWLPNWNEKKYGIIPEIIINAILLFLIILLWYF